MFKKVMPVIVAMVMLAGAVTVGVPAALADSGENNLVRIWVDGVGWVECFNDGRLNDCDLDVPVAVFYSRVATQAVDENGSPLWYDDGTQAWQDVITGVELWGYVPGHDDPVRVAFVSVDQIKAAVTANGGADTILAEGDGYAFGYSATGWFWVTAPNGYSFVWAVGDLLA